MSWLLCASCYVWFEHEHGPGPIPKFCSDRCRKRIWLRAKLDRQYIERWGSPDNPKLRCGWCHKPVMPKRAAGGHAAFCSKACCDRLRRNKYMARDVECDICEGPIDFEAKINGRRIRTDTRVCSRKCWRMRQAERKRLKNAAGYRSQSESLMRRIQRGSTVTDKEGLLAIIRERQRLEKEPEGGEDEDE